MLYYYCIHVLGGDRFRMYHRVFFKSKNLAYTLSRDFKITASLRLSNGHRRLEQLSRWADNPRTNYYPGCCALTRPGGLAPAGEIRGPGKSRCESLWIDGKEGSDGGMHFNTSTAGGLRLGMRASTTLSVLVTVLVSTSNGPLSGLQGLPVAVPLCPSRCQPEFH
jgi:hypothetical protein